LKLRAIVKIDRRFDGVDNTIVKERWRIRGLNEARRVKSPIAEAAVGSAMLLKPPSLSVPNPPSGGREESAPILFRKNASTPVLKLKLSPLILAPAF